MNILSVDMETSVDLQKPRFAPIVLFVYKRLDVLTKSIESLKNNPQASYCDLHIFSDGPKGESDKAEVCRVRSFIKTVKGFKSVVIHESEVNKGLAKSIIEGVSKILEISDSVIVLEDDLVVSDNFLSFMNQALRCFAGDAKVFSVAGYTYPIELPDADYYVTMRASSNGWGTWRDRWERVDWKVVDYPLLRQRRNRRDFNKMGSDLSRMLKRQMKGKINSWAIRWTFQQYREQTLTIYPTISKVINIGFGDGATHTRNGASRLWTKLDVSGKQVFDFNSGLDLKEFYLNQFLHNYSIKTRIYYKIADFLFVLRRKCILL